MTGLVLFYIGSFFLGAIPTAYLVSKKIKGIDIRLHGSGNVGATNALRVLGKKWGLAVFAADFLKGVIPAFLASHFFSTQPQASFIGLGSGIAAMLGHIYTPFLGFKGGKGIATGAGGLCGAYPVLFLAVIPIWGVLMYFTGIVSLSCLLAVACIIPISWFYAHDSKLTGLFFLLSGLLCWSHRENIGRLLRGEEQRFVKK